MGIISSMILSRYYDMANYGTYKQVMYVYNTLLIVFTLGLPRAYSYFLPRVPNNQAFQLIKKITSIFFVLGTVFSITLFVFSGVIANILKNDELEVALRIFAIVPTLLLPTMGLEGILATYKQSSKMALYTVVTRAIMLLSVIVPVCFFHGGYIEAICGFVFSSVISLLIASYLKYSPIKDEGKDKCTISLRDIFKFSVPLLTASIWGMIIESSDQFFVSRYFGNEVFADFSNGNMNMPFIGMITGATTTVLSPVFSRMNYDKVDPHTEIFPLWKSVFEKSAMLIYPMVLYCLVFADVIMVFLYGKQYEVSGVFFQIKLLTNFFTIIAFAPLLINIGKVKFFSSVHFYGAISLVVLEFIAVSLFKTPYSISVTSAVCSIGRVLVMLLAISKFFEVRFKELFPTRLLFSIILPSLIILVFIRWSLFKFCSFNVIYTIGFSLLLYVVLFAFYCYLAKIDYLKILKSLKK
ncbi:MAG: oligosaccharide flippase family protein [Parabacteroides sp.]|nr:oligosaccharide flippase family protein [Parabacteroides sp.]